MLLLREIPGRDGTAFSGEDGVDFRVACRRDGGGDDGLGREVPVLLPPGRDDEFAAVLSGEGDGEEDPIPLISPARLLCCFKSPSFTVLGLLPTTPTILQGVVVSE